MDTPAGAESSRARARARARSGQGTAAVSVGSERAEILQTIPPPGLLSRGWGGGGLDAFIKDNERLSVSVPLCQQAMPS